MSEALSEPDQTSSESAAPAEASKPAVPADVEHEGSSAGTGDFTTEVDPTFIPDESGETPEEKRAREHPEPTGS
ncbi:hypothetical protein J2Y41_001224 [Arthrobacter sp. 1088]|uniref:hypothetical protein n=1 Tax=Arthrobacter sp. 1088 TaxID=2817768 RepID=UPI00285DA6A8|nr:hypothetical protein [Arthrobacter sp. 1088]MDR6685669.1 hypothetical protein [Arthrobacter sp. 1088]